QPYDSEKVRKTLKAERHPEGNADRPIYRCRPEKSQVGLAIWSPDDHTLLVGFQPEDLEKSPSTPHQGVALLPGPVETVLTERVGQGGQVWVVGHSDNWTRTAVFKLLPDQLLKKEDREILAGMRTFALWLQFQDGLTLNGAFECADADAATALHKYLEP